MSNMSTESGVISETATTKRIVWTIPMFSSFRRTIVNGLNVSPSFIFMNTSLYFRVSLSYGMYGNDWLSVFLDYDGGSVCDEFGSICDLAISVSIQKSDGTLFGTKTAKGNIFNMPCIEISFPAESNLRTQNSELLPSDTLTIICDLKSDLKHTLSLAEEANNMKEKTAFEPWEHSSLTGENSLCQDYKKVFLDGQNHDLILKVGDKEFPVHRDILRARSRVFESMLNHDMKEKNSGIIDVPDCDPNAMKEFLLYVYCGKVETLDESNMIGLYYAADKYDVWALKEQCRNFIKKSLSPTNACEVIQLALNHSDSNLQESTTEYFCSNSHNIFRTLEWQSFLKDNSTVANELLIKSIDALRNAKN